MTCHNLQVINRVLAMIVKADKVTSLLEEINALIQLCEEAELEYAEYLEKVSPEYEVSARNLVHYRALRSIDITNLQKRLGALGLSRIARAQGHVMASLKSTRSILESMMSGPANIGRFFLSRYKGKKLVRTHSKALLGYRSKGRRVRIMVTQPTESAWDTRLINDLIASGMNSARINCAHDGPEVWKKMIENIRNASKKRRRKVKICMDLGGPKIRTGAMKPGPRVVTFAPQRDVRGRVIGPAMVHLTSEWYPLAEKITPLPLHKDFLQSLEIGDRLVFKDTRGKKRSIKIVDAGEEGWIGQCFDRVYLETGMRVENKRTGIRARVGMLPAIEQYILLKVDDTLILHRDGRYGEPAVTDKAGNVLRYPHISCTAPEIFSAVKEGDRVLFDDGKIEGEVVKVDPGEALDVKIFYARKGGQKLRADKGINFPDHALGLRGLTEKDRQDLQFVVKHADVVNMSFVNNAQDVEDLLDALKKLEALGRLGIILKIETREGYDNLTEIMLTAMQTYPVGVMIARGDLAVEVGWENMPRIQEEILSLCLAAHMPDIWATQVLEGMAKKGLPSRAEVTDAARAQRSECVMLNKGPYIVDTIQLLDKILVDMKDYQDKNSPFLPVLH